ncbi:hypothetical protein [Pantoea sp. BAV 3049]|uniref:hypothetical protein n=1 Tax=Pantoea sp. BAV 3049 TaxID=2654188 RepID=UPI00131AD144|nr:hypothetical protein [Pantoea sp. BAV 3049]
MTEGKEVTETAVSAEPAVASAQVTDKTDLVLAKLKELVAAAGAQTHEVIDDLIELAKKLA